MVVLGGYIDGNVPRNEVITIGAFTLLWLAMAFPINIRRDYFVLLGLIIELIIVITMERVIK